MKGFSKQFALVGGLLIAFWCTGCKTSTASDGGEGGSSGSGGAQGCSPSFDIEGGFEERYSCQTDGVCTEEDVTIYLDIRPDDADDDPSDGKDYMFCETGGLGPLCIEDPPGTFKFSGMGTLCGELFTWSAISPENFTETGTWRFSEGGDVFEKMSTYFSIGGDVGGTCVGMARRGGGAAEPPPCVE